MRHTFLLTAFFIGVIAAATLRAEDETGRYFAQLRQRGLFSVAEHYALSRLADMQLPAELRTELTAELSTTFAAHAAIVSPQQREELWDRARDVVAEALKVSPPDADLLRAQLALVTARRSEVLWWDAIASPQDSVAHARALQAADDGVEQLNEQIKQLEAGLKTGTRRMVGAVPPHEQRQLLQGLQLELGQIHRRRAALLPAGTPDRVSAVVDAQSAFQDVRSNTNDVRRETLAKIGLADCARLQRDFRKAREMCAAITGLQPTPDRDLLHAVEAIRLRCLLDEGQPLQAAETFLTLRRTEAVLPGELWLIQMQTLLQLRAEAEKKAQPDLITQLDNELELVQQRIDEQAGGPWSLWARRLRESDQSRRRYGESLDRLVTRARAEYQAGHAAEAAPLLAEAVQAARQQNQHDLAVELGTLHGSALLAINQFDAAAAAFRSVVEAAPDHPQAAANDLLAAYALGRFYEQQRTQSRRLAYTTALEQHLERFHDGPTVGDALFMLAQLHEQRLQFSQALPLYLRIAADHPRYHAGTAGAARCDTQLVLRLKSLKREWQPFHAEAVAELSRRMATWDSSWSPDQGEAALQLARLQLWAEPADAVGASKALERFETAAAAVTTDQERWRTLWQQAVPLKLVAWAGSGRSVQARQVLAAAQLQQPAELLAVVIGLDQLAAGNADSQFVDLTELLVDAVRRLEPFRDRLSAEARSRFDLVRVRAYLVSGRVSQALEVANAISSDANAQRALANVLMTSRDPAVLTAAIAVWQKLESQAAAGSDDWLSARLQTIETYIALGQPAEAAKLLKLTELLYPQPESVDWQRRYAELEQRLR